MKRNVLFLLIVLLAVFFGGASVEGTPYNNAPSGFSFFTSSAVGSQYREPGTRRPKVSIRFEFDKRLKERPYRVYISTTEEMLTDETLIEPSRFQFYEHGKTSYDFFNIKPGRYWVGFSFRYLHKDWRVDELVYVDPGVRMDDTAPPPNQIDVKTNKRIVIDIEVELEFVGSVYDVEAHSIVKRTRPKTPEERMMLDENFFIMPSGFFNGAKMIRSRDVDHKKIFFSLAVFDEYLSDKYK